MVIMFVLGAQRGLSSTVVFTSAVALAIAAIPEAMPTVLQVVMSLGAADLARHGAVLTDLASVETLGSTSAINSDKTGTLTMNQMTAIEVVDPTDRYTISGSGYELEGTVQHAAGSSDTIEDAILPYVVASDAALVDGKVVGDPTEGALLVLAHKAGLDIDGTRDRYPRLATLPFDPTYKLMAAFAEATDASGARVVRCFVKGAAPAVISHASSALSAGQSIPWDEDLRTRAEASMRRMGETGLRVMAAAYRDLDPGSFDADGDLLSYVEGLEMTSLVGMVDPPRAESKQAVRGCPERPHPSADGHRRRRDHRCGDRHAAGDRGRGDPRRRVRRARRVRAAGADRPDRRRRPGRARAQGAARRDAQAAGPRGRDDRRRRQRRALDQGRAHRRRDGQRDRGGQERGADDPHRRQLRDDRARRLAGPKALRQPQQVRPLRADFASCVRADVPRRDRPEHRRGPAVHAGAGALHPLLRQRSVRGRARPRPGDARD